MAVKRGRPPKKPQANWKVGAFDASYEEGHYILRAGKSLMVRTKSEDEFKATCALIESGEK